MDTTERVELNPSLPYPSKSKCAKILKQAFGPKTRYMQIGPTTIAVVEYVAGKHERHLVEVSAQAPEGVAILYWAAFVSAFKAIGYNVERIGEDGKLTRLEMIPIYKTSEVPPPKTDEGASVAPDEAPGAEINT